ncbi:helix-turn-helix transcriptional regulator [Nocardioides maradonensis]
MSELGAFLRARRTDVALEPLQPSLGARRVSGLRREEVAAAAGISVHYYTRLEQGRETNPSDAVVHALAAVLRLEPDAVEHLHRLRAGASEVSPAGLDPDTGARMQSLVEAVRPNPAYVLDRLSNVVAANPEGLAVFPGLADLPAAERNTCRYLLTDPRARDIFRDWEDIARGAVAHLRAANATDLNEQGLRLFVAELSALSPLFADWWNGHVVERRRSSIQRMTGPEGTEVARRYEVLHLPDERLRMTLWLPA